MAFSTQYSWFATLHITLYHSQLVNWAVNYEWTMGCLLWPTVWPIPRVNTIKPNSLWEKSSTFVSLIKDNDILSSNTPLAITLCTDVRPKHLRTVSMHSVVPDDLFPQLQFKRSKLNRLAWSSQLICGYYSIMRVTGIFLHWGSFKRRI